MLLFVSRHNLSLANKFGFLFALAINNNSLTKFLYNY